MPEFGPVDPFETSLTGETVGNLVPDDYYRFTLSRGGRITAELRKLLADADLVLYDVRNEPIAYSMREGITDEQIIADLIPGTYMLRVNSPKGVTTDYELIVKFQHKLSATQTQPLPPGWRPSGGGNSGGSGGSGGGNTSPGVTFADPRIKQIYNTALNRFATAERGKANAKIQDLDAEKRRYQQELEQLLAKMNDEQRAKIHGALDGVRNQGQGWVNDKANGIKGSIDGTADSVLNQIDGLIPSRVYDIPGLGDRIRGAKDSLKGAINGARSWLKDRVNDVQSGINGAISWFVEQLKNAYRTGAEINDDIERLSQELKNKIDEQVRNLNNSVDQFKGKVIGSLGFLRNVGVDIPEVNVWGKTITPGFKWNFYDSVVTPLADQVANPIKNTVTSVGNSLKGAVDFVKPLAQGAVAEITSQLFGDETGKFYNKIKGVDQQIANIRAGVERAINDQAAFYKGLLDDFLNGLGEAKDFVVGALFGNFNSEASLWQILFDAAIPTVVGLGLDIIAPGAGRWAEVGISAAQGIRDLLAELNKAFTKTSKNQPLEFGDWFGLVANALGAAVSVAPLAGPYLRSLMRIIGKGSKGAALLADLKKLGGPVVDLVIGAFKQLDRGGLTAKAGDLLAKALDTLLWFVRKLKDGFDALKNFFSRSNVPASQVGVNVSDETRALIVRTENAIVPISSQAKQEVSEKAPEIWKTFDDAAVKTGEGTNLIIKIINEQLSILNDLKSRIAQLPSPVQKKCGNFIADVDGQIKSANEFLLNPDSITDANRQGLINNVGGLKAGLDDALRPGVELKAMEVTEFNQYLGTGGKPTRLDNIAIDLRDNFTVFSEVKSYANQVTVNTFNADQAERVINAALINGLFTKARFVFPNGVAQEVKEIIQKMASQKNVIVEIVG